MLSKQTMMHAQIHLAANQNIRVSASQIREEVESENHGAIGGVLKGDDALGDGAGLDGGEDVGDGRLGYDGVVWVGKVI